MFRSFFFPDNAMDGAAAAWDDPARSLNPPRHDLRFLILGAGIHGLYLANMLVAAGGIDPARIALVDRHRRPLGQWRRVTAATGMTHLRSTSVHHIDPEPVSLRRFYRERKAAYPDAYAAPYNRPSLQLFNDHADWSSSRLGTARRLQTASATAIDTIEGGYRLETEAGAFEADNLILAPGQGALRRPDWSAELEREYRVEHLFSEDFDLDEWRRGAAEGAPVTIVGAGISAMQAAVSIARAASRPISVLALHDTRIRQFDSDPGWIGPRFLGRFTAHRDPDQRRKILASSRYPGSGDPQTVRSFESLVEAGSVRFRSCTPEELPALTAESLGAAGEGRLLLATGYRPVRPGGAAVDRLVASEGLPVAACGFPVVNPYLAWMPGLFVSGALGELEIGPVARNITGARRAGERLYRLLSAAGEASG